MNPLILFITATPFLLLQILAVIVQIIGSLVVAAVAAPFALFFLIYAAITKYRKPGQ